ncbi:MAG: helix-turn-helix transcriptional regulator [Lachnospiraceae bacterium]|nr:helix-turn-helix transcriptional regulator [Lachnospiraceae bacterium]
MAATVFSTQLQKLRKTKGIKQEQLAEHLGVSTQAVSKWENGSYPDGDLLPRIAEYFEVSIDYLYGNESKEMCLEQQVQEYLRKKRKENENEQTKLEWMKEFLWAMQGSVTNSGAEDYIGYFRAKKENGRAASGIMLDNGFTYMRKTEDLEYYCLFEVPERGLEEYFSNTEELAKLFRLFSKEDNLWVMYYMMSLNSGECVRAETVAKAMNIPVEQVREVLEQAYDISDYGCIVSGTSLLDECDKKEYVYGTERTYVSRLLIMLAAAQDMLYAVQNWHGLSHGMGKAWMDRKKVVELCNKKSRGETERKEKKE